MRKEQIHNTSFLSRIDRIEAKSHINQKEASKLNDRKVQFLVLKLGKQSRFVKSNSTFQFKLKSFYQELEQVLIDRNIRTISKSTRIV